jgi:hypothetical protein
MQQTPSDKPSDKKKFLGVNFRCCNVYCRVYINNQRTAYEGRCPKCGKKVAFQIGSGGVDNRFFDAW